jgi:Rrf2 family transcriptional regulator, cysteine metabolism repressor
MPSEDYPMKLTQSASYAIHATLRLVENKESAPIPCSKLAEQGKMPERFLLQILRDLAKHGILISTRGGSGGFMLGRPPDEISLLEVIEAVEGPLKATLPLRAALPHSAGERLDQALCEVNEEIRRQLQAISLSDLLAKAKRG